jgi:histidinol-phosphate/aromatic aminotransferase/cobyric acid decarboxylase-like protein
MAANRAGLKVIEDGLARLGVEHADSQTNFLYVQPPMTAFDCARSLRERGVIVRDVGAGIRISVGTEPENRRLLEAFEDLLKTR